MDERTLNYTLIISDILKVKYDNKISNVPIDNNFLKLTRTAYIKYEEYVREKRENEEKLEREKEQAKTEEAKRETEKSNF